MEAFLLHVPDQNVVHAFETDGPRFADFWNVVRRVIHMFVTQNQRGAFLGPVNETDLGGQNHDAGAFRAYQRFGNVEAALGQKLVETITGYAARNVGIAAANEISVLIAQGAQARINFTATATG